MKNRFCSFFLFLLFVDSGIIVLKTILNLKGMNLLTFIILSSVQGWFGTLFAILAIVQVIIAFKSKLKRAAKIIGLYPLFFTFIAMVVNPLIDSTNASHFFVSLSIYNLLVGLGQLSVGIWAAKQLTSGHYEPASD